MSVQFKTEKEYSEILETLRDRATTNNDFQSIIENLFRSEMVSLKDFEKDFMDHEINETILYWFVAELYQANDISYTIRYNESTGLVPLKVVKGVKTYTTFELIKALRSVRYQIEVSHKYKDQLDKIISHLALCVVEDDPGYKNAETW